MGCPFYDGPIGITVDDDQVVFALIVEEICADCLKRVVRHDWRSGWRIGLRRGHPVAVVAVVPKISAVMPGQKIAVSALAIIKDTP